MPSYVWYVNLCVSAQALSRTWRWVTDRSQASSFQQELQQALTHLGVQAQVCGWVWVYVGVCVCMDVWLGVAGCIRLDWSGKR